MQLIALILIVVGMAFVLMAHAYARKDGKDLTVAVQMKKPVSVFLTAREMEGLTLKHNNVFAMMLGLEMIARQDCVAQIVETTEGNLHSQIE